VYTEEVSYIDSSRDQSDMRFLDEVGALVFDIGHYSIRAGYAGEDSPKAEIPSMVGVINEPIETGMMDVDSQNQQRKFFLDTTSIHVPRKGMDMTTFLKDGMSMFFCLID